MRKPIEMTADQSLKLFEIVNRYFKNDDDSKAFVTEIDKLVTERSKEEARQLATREDLIREISLSKQDLAKEINQSKVDMIKWMFGFWVTLVLLILANWFLKH